MELVLSRRVRAGSTSQRRVEFLDFVVDSCSIYDELCDRGYDFVSCLGWLEEGSDGEARNRLSLLAPGDLPSGRCSLFVCPECADLGCGSISARISKADDVVVWSDLGYENDYEPSFHPLPDLGPFSFPVREYLAALSAP